MADDWKFLVVADRTAEFPAAALYAALRARVTGSGVVVLRVVEPVGEAHWLGVGDEIRRQAHEDAAALLASVAADMRAAAGIEPEIQIRQGEPRAEIRAVLEADPAIRILVLASASEGEGPGPLVASLAKGNAFGGRRPVPVVVVPGALSREEIAALAVPGGALAPP
jgi:hypothetical protein